MLISRGQFFYSTKLKSLPKLVKIGENDLKYGSYKHAKFQNNWPSNKLTLLKSLILAFSIHVLAFEGLFEKFKSDFDLHLNTNHLRYLAALWDA